MPCAMSSAIFTLEDQERLMERLWSKSSREPPFIYCIQDRQRTHTDVGMVLIQKEKEM